MGQLQRRLVGSTLFALFTVYLTLGGSDLDGWDLSDATTAMVGFVLVGLMVFRAWPALEDVWARQQQPNARHPLAPSWPRAIGAASVGLVFVLTRSLADHLLSSTAEIHVTGLIHDLFGFTVIGYFVWPAVSAKLLRLRAR